LDYLQKLSFYRSPDPWSGFFTLLDPFQIDRASIKIITTIPFFANAKPLLEIRTAPEGLEKLFDG